jgi:hypothetical protein
MHHEEIELNFDASCQQILGLESEILLEARSSPTLASNIPRSAIPTYDFGTSLYLYCFSREHGVLRRL